jgi:hypothetical protein
MQRMTSATLLLRRSSYTHTHTHTHKKARILSKRNDGEVQEANMEKYLRELIFLSLLFLWKEKETSK